MPIAVYPITTRIRLKCSSWKSDAYPYGVRQSKWRGGKGDVVADYVASCRKSGIYCSMGANAYCDVFDNFTVKGANGPTDPRQVEYRRRAERLATELWGNCGPLAYIWFDGGTLPPDKGGPDLVPILKRLQPHAVIMEQITQGERIRRYVLEGLVGGRWTELARGQSIGHKRIERFHPVEVTKVRIRATEAVAEPLIRKLAVYNVKPVAYPKPAVSPRPNG